MSTEPQVVMGPLVDSAVDATIPSPCDLAIGPNQYRRVMWENYNPSKANNIFPPSFTPSIIPSDGWETEIIDKDTRVYDVYPFSSLPSYYVPPAANTGTE